MKKNTTPKRRLWRSFRHTPHLRKQRDINLPKWKECWNHFNERRLGWLEHIVESLIPWLVLLLLFIILGEFSSFINIFGWEWMERITLFFEHNKTVIALIDNVIIAFFVLDLYFNFFKKATFWSFLKSSFIDIIAIAPLGLIFRISELSEAQSILHIGADIEKEAAKTLREGEIIAKLIQTEELAKATQLSRGARAVRVIARLPRILRLYRIFDFFNRKRLAKKSAKR